MRILFVGDIHGRFGDLNVLINKQHPDITIQLGDNAYFWMNEQATGKIKPGNSKVYLLPGNHEDWFQIEGKIGRLGRDPIEVEKNLFYCPIGSVLKLDDIRIMFIGGADSIDKKARHIGVTWFPQEILTQKDVDFCTEYPFKIDMICSHTCPWVFNVFNALGIYEKAYDPTSRYLDLVFNALHPSFWAFGHWHDYITGEYKRCHWHGLSHAVNTKWWMVLDDKK